MTPPNQEKTGLAIITINAKIIDGKVDPKSVKVTQNMGQWSHAALVLTEASKVAITQIIIGESKEDKPVIYVPIGPAGRMM